LPGGQRVFSGSGRRVVAKAKDLTLKAKAKDNNNARYTENIRSTGELAAMSDEGRPAGA